MGSDVDRRARTITSGDIIHIAEFVMMLVTLGMFIQTMKYTAAQVDKHTDQLNRIEHYLSSRDPEYWERTKEGTQWPQVR